MRITLSMLRCPDAVPLETRTARGGEISIGRGPDNSWVLPDPERHVSNRHCVLALCGDGWQLIDRSTNGTVLRRDEADILVHGDTRDLRDSDRLSLGPYEIEVRLEETDVRPPDEGEHGSDPFRPGSGSTDSTGLPPHFNPWPLPGEGVEEALPPLPPVLEPAPGPQDLLRAFLAGAGISDAVLQDSAATMHALGAAFRAVVAGLRRVLIARSALKGEFRIEQTMVQVSGNNPLKFSADDDDALAALLGIGRRTEMAPADAVADALRDIRLHELASVAAMQAAVRALVQGLGPEAVGAPTQVRGGGLAAILAQRKARAWDAYEALHARTLAALSDDFDSVFGRAFARAYEQALQEIEGSEALAATSRKRRGRSR